MQVGSLYDMAKALGESEKEIWKKNILASLDKQPENIISMSLEELVVAVYSCFDENYNILGMKSIAYGAGKMAQKYIPFFRKKIDFYEIWDAYSNISSIDEIQVVRPKTQIRDLDIPFLVFIDDTAIRNDVIASYRKKGYKNIFYFRDYITILEHDYVFDDLRECMTARTRDIVNDFYLQYEVVENMCCPVLFSVLKKDWKTEELCISNKIFSEAVLLEKLKAVIIINQGQEESISKILHDFLHVNLKNKFEIAHHFEIMLRELLSGSVKTVTRPMRMMDDEPYDSFSITAVINEVLLYLFEDCDIILALIRSFLQIAEKPIPLMVSECYFLMKNRKYNDALEVVRKAVKKEPNNLLANEMFYQTAIRCKSEGIYVDEPTPEYDLSERFCWSGLNFVWCGGFDNQTGLAEFLPCFRSLQCGAHPKGEFWSGDDWKEFRKSVTDGSFKYCQKNQCPNIVGGWLPKKSDCNADWLRKILDGDMSVIPPIEELHFSYDRHCNLKCPSCRLEIETSTKEQNERLDRLYEKNLKPYMAQAKHLTLSGCGEAIIAPHSKKILQSFSKDRNPNLAVELRTNATTINPVTWNSLGTGKDVIRHITVSIDGASKETFEKLRCPARWETVLRNLEFVQMLRNSGQIDMFEFHVVIQSDNITQLCDIAKLAMRYDADAVTYSKFVNWRGLSDEEYHHVNPFWHDHPLHVSLLEALEKLEKLRENIKNNMGRKMYINIHFRPDPDSTYDEIRTGRLKIR